MFSMKYMKPIQSIVCVTLTDLEARERRAEAQTQEEVQITRTLEEEVSKYIEYMKKLTASHCLKN